MSACSMGDFNARGRKRKLELMGARMEALVRAPPLLLWPDPG
jgi:hypothetical protein